MVRIFAIVVVAALIVGGGIVLYMLNMPHRNVQNSDTDFSLSSTQLVSEYLSDTKTANNKYLAEDGNSKILEVSGTVAEIAENFNGQKVLLLKESSDKAGTNCIFLKESMTNVSKVKIGETVTVKGVIRSGAAYDVDLELYENVIIDKCDIIIPTRK